MLTVNIICIGKLKEKYLVDGCNEYTKRLRAFCNINIIELSEYKVPDNPSQKEIENCIEKEGEKILSKITNGSFVVSMCIEGKILSSEELAERLKFAADNSFSTVNFVIGGSFGLSPKLKELSNLKLSMSRMTFPHQLARVMILEQIYRGFGINTNSKYHK
ncbi:MAG: 23S rRNA (pseudouridine(1915)-N(3))-methyltransferase RlmH [Oscillospiraceae bacterium]